MNATRSLAANGRIPAAGTSQKQRPAFTVVELLVVMGVLAILGLLALPALARTRPNTKIAQCCNNLRQWTLAMQMYTSENGDKLFRDGMGADGMYPSLDLPTGTHADTNAWFNLLPPYVAEKTLLQYWAAPGFSGNRMYCVPFPGGLGRIWQCPSAGMTAAQVQTVGGGFEGFFSYDMNMDLKKQTPSTDFAYPSMPKRTAFARPAATVFFFDCAFNPVTEIVNSAPQYNSVNPANRWRSFASRHSAGGVVSFLDGHAKYFTDRYVTNGAGSYEGLNPDIIWNAPYRVLNP